MSEELVDNGVAANNPAANVQPNVRGSKFCSECGGSVGERAVVCPACGSPISQRVGQRNKTVAGVLALFLGGLGVHKFYLGKNGMGILYLLLCWTCIPALIGLIEAIQMFSMSDMEFNTRYN